ncbi:MAG: MFS transporter [Alphaproteobacteria bacterium]
MLRALVPVAALLSSVALLLVGNGLQTTLLPLRGQAAGFDSLALGILGSSYFLGFLAGCLFGPRVVARAGHIRTFAAMVSIASCIALAHALLVLPLTWWLLRAGTGMCFAVLYMVIESWLNDKASNETRGVVFSVYVVINLTMITAGQLLLLLDRGGTIALYLIASILVSLAAVPVALTRSDAPAPMPAARLDLGRLLRTSPVGVVGCFAVGLTNGAFWAYGPVFAEALAPVAADTADAGKAAADYAALFMSASVLGGAIGQFPLGWLSDRVDRRLVIIGGAVCGALAGVGVATTAIALPDLMLPAGFALGLFAFSLYAIAVAHVNDVVPREEFVQVAGGLLLIWSIGAVTGPLAASAAIAAFGPPALFAYTAAVYVGLAGFALYRLPRRAAPSPEEKTEFREAAIVGQTVAAIDVLPPAEEGAKADA